MPGGGVRAGFIDVVGLAMIGWMWSTIPIQRSHWSRSDVKEAILDHKCDDWRHHHYYSGTRAEPSYMTCAKLTFIDHTGPGRRVCPVYDMCITREEVHYYPPRLT